MEVSSTLQPFSASSHPAYGNRRVALKHPLPYFNIPQLQIKGTGEKSMNTMKQAQSDKVGYCPTCPWPTIRTETCLVITRDCSSRWDCSHPLPQAIPLHKFSPAHFNPGKLLVTRLYYDFPVHIPFSQTHNSENRDHILGCVKMHWFWD